ncbi:helix-turn-helix transcriptional regulator [Craterilacuibacter sinensis]|uniref:AlpA family phage regulatory protein n=1 Tax=Craterilacuibacter sinensis TaxID=2686017 RepID=A0A845BQH0_9NEIS|nr:AlpA family phage regulatory protein [Craterilacuibacter sinensis]MXR36691.1 AlpA family phage regulatory protein [Craterilacuibacter sinensis]
MLSHVTPATIQHTGYIRGKQILASILPVGRTTLWRMVKRGQFPAPVRLGPNISAWRAEDVRDWLEQRKGEQL